MHLSTVLARSPATILAHLSALSSQYSDHVLLFALSPNAPPTDLAKLVKNLTAFSSQSIGCLSAPLPGHPHALLSCSFALLDRGSCVPFRSEVPGRASPQVGRRHALRQKGAPTPQGDIPSGTVDWENVWDQSLTTNELPGALQNLSLDEVASIVYFSDSAPEGLSNTLARFPSATKLGLFAASTPFITGRPVTLFEGDKIHGSGAVGVALKGPKPDASVQFLGMKALSSPMVVTQAEGNLVVSLDNKNPTQLLLSAIRVSGLESAVSTSLKDNDEFSLATLEAGEPHRMCNIMSGDPSRGTIALRSMSAPPVGANVQFFHRPKSANITIPRELTQSSVARHTLAFMACPEAQQYLNPESDANATDVVLRDTFLAASEGGFISSRSRDGLSETTWSCAIPGSLATLRWKL
ncbi:hypothetical protein C8R46DRAFT_1079214 [Mycena filopes]|nr:hypothetical protein C8R46DRAFT_1079214 [Mycena filopes]